MPKLRPWTPIAVAAAALFVAPGAQAASSAVSVTSGTVTSSLSTAKGRTATVTVRNTGTRRLTGLTLRSTGRRGVSVRIRGAERGVRRLGTLRAGRSTRVSVTLRRRKGGPRTGTVGFRVVRRGTVVGRTRVAFGRPPVAESLVGRYYWGSTYTLNGIDQSTLLFTSPSLVFTGDAEGGYPTCTAVGETCRPYTYDARSKALTIDGKPATIAGDKLSLDGQDHVLLGSAKAGARWDTVLTYSNSSGVCPLYCSYVTETLTFLPDGRFIRGAVASGSGPVVDYGVVPADRKGTYEVRGDRTLRLAFADGTERVETLAIYPDAAGSFPANPSAGIVLDGDGYFDIRD